MHVLDWLKKLARNQRGNAIVITLPPVTLIENRRAFIHPAPTPTP